MDLLLTLGREMEIRDLQLSDSAFVHSLFLFYLFLFTIFPSITFTLYADNNGKYIR